jgi:diamine N-acetyltransferase
VLQAAHGTAIQTPPATVDFNWRTGGPLYYDETLFIMSPLEGTETSYSGRKARLRPLRATDKQRFLVWRNDPDVRDFSLGFVFPVTAEMEDRWFEAAMNDQTRTRALFAIEDLEDDRLVGFVQLNRIDWTAHVGWFGIAIGEKDRQGKGLATEAMHLILRFGFHYLNLRKICLEVPSLNRRATELYTRIGFRPEGILQGQVYSRGEFHDLILMALFRENYREG